MTDFWIGYFAALGVVVVTVGGAYVAMVMREMRKDGQD